MTDAKLDATSAAAFLDAVMEVGASDSVLLLSVDDRERDAARIITWARVAWVQHNALCGESPEQAHEFADRIVSAIDELVEGVPVDG